MRTRVLSAKITMSYKRHKKQAPVENRSGPGVERKLGLFPLTNIVIASMIGSGILTTGELLMSDLDNRLLMLAL
jgi:hypothetical protein